MDSEIRYNRFLIRYNESPPQKKKLICPKWASVENSNTDYGILAII